MRPRGLALLAAATALVASGCAAPAFVDPPTDPASPAPAPVPVQPVGHQEHTAEVALCTVLPTRVVGDLIGTGAALDATGDGSQCTWRGPGTAPGSASGSSAAGTDLAGTEGPTVQGALLDVSAFHAGRPAPDDPTPHAVVDVPHVGDEAFVVRLGDAAPTTLYVRDGQRALSLWLDDVALTPAATERSLARMATLLLRLA